MTQRRRPLGGWRLYHWLWWKIPWLCNVLYWRNPAPLADEEDEACGCCDPDDPTVHAHEWCQHPCCPMWDSPESVLSDELYFGKDLVFLPDDWPCRCWCHKPENWGHHWGMTCCPHEGAWTVSGYRQVHGEDPPADLVLPSES